MPRGMSPDSAARIIRAIYSTIHTLESADSDYWKNTITELRNALTSGRSECCLHCGRVWPADVTFGCPVCSGEKLQDFTI